jgi:hypothetical protein
MDIPSTGSTVAVFPSDQGMDFCVMIALKGIYEHLGHETTKSRAFAFLQVTFSVKMQKLQPRNLLQHSAIFESSML